MCAEDCYMCVCAPLVSSLSQTLCKYHFHFILPDFSALFIDAGLFIFAPFVICCLLLLVGWRMGEGRVHSWRSRRLPAANPTRLPPYCLPLNDFLVAEATKAIIILHASRKDIVRTCHLFTERRGIRQRTDTTLARRSHTHTHTLPLSGNVGKILECGCGRLFVSSYVYMYIYMCVCHVRKRGG